jgi:hypothetical protein
MSMLYVMWEASLLVRELLALQEGNALGWLSKESLSISGRGRVFSHLHNIQTNSEASPASYSVHSSKPLISV